MCGSGVIEDNGHAVVVLGVVVVAVAVVLAENGVDLVREGSDEKFFGLEHGEHEETRFGGAEFGVDGHGLGLSYGTQNGSDFLQQKGRLVLHLCEELCE